MSAVVNQISASKQNEATILVSTSFVSNRNHKVEPMNLGQRTDDKEIKMHANEVISKIETLENQIE